MFIDFGFYLYISPSHLNSWTDPVYLDSTCLMYTSFWLPIRDRQHLPNARIYRLSYKDADNLQIPNWYIATYFEFYYVIKAMFCVAIALRIEQSPYSVYILFVTLPTFIVWNEKIFWIFFPLTYYNVAFKLLRHDCSVYGSQRNSHWFCKTSYISGTLISNPFWEFNSISFYQIYGITYICIYVNIARYL